MFVKLLIALTCLFFQPTINHYIGNLDECTASKVCNHTWTPVCGNFEADSSHRLFLDDCDLHEYNCDNNTTYVEVETKECEARCTQSDHANTTTTPKVSTIKSTEGTKTETTKVTSTKKVTETNTDKTDTTTTTFVDPTTLTMTTEKTTKTTRQTSEITTQATVTTQLTEKTDTPTEITTVTEITTPRNLTLPTEDENTIPEDTTEAPNKTTSDATTTKRNDKPDCLHCFVPSTWETTAVGETRDFIQILKERFGDRVKILRDTTHYPKYPTYARKRLAFLPGNHMERRKRRFY